MFHLRPIKTKKQVIGKQKGRPLYATLRSFKWKLHRENTLNKEVIKYFPNITLTFSTKLPIKPFRFNFFNFSKFQNFHFTDVKFLLTKLYYLSGLATNYLIIIFSPNFLLLCFRYYLLFQNFYFIIYFLHFYIFFL